MPTHFETTDAAGSASTSYTLANGQFLQGQVTSNGDQDWYAVSLVAGQSYIFSLVGTGSHNLQDPYLRLYGPGGSVQLASNDDGLVNQNSVIHFTATTSGTYFLAASAFGSGTGQYGLAMTTAPRAVFDAQMGAGALDADSSWATGPVTLTWAARNTFAGSVDASGDAAPFQRLSSAQINAVALALTNYSDVCGLTFSRVTGTNGYSNSATMLFSAYESSSDGAGAYAYYPGSTSASADDGDVRINNTYNSENSLPLGSYEYFVLLHEIGHAVGLSHPGDYNAAPGVDITFDDHAEFTADSRQYTVMSYFSYGETAGTETNASGVAIGEPDTLLLYDILALQQIYGANTATRSGATTYGFGGTLDNGGAYDLSTNLNPLFCIWDGGGIDTLNLSGYTAGQMVNLNEGAFSDIGGFLANVSIAYGTIIENVVGGNGNDVIRLTSLNTNNTINGGGGFDRVVVTYTYGHGYGITGTATNLVISGSAGTDTLTNVEQIEFADGTIRAVGDFFGGSPPVVTSPSSATVTENATGIAYQAAATDPDAGTTLSYALSGTDAARFTINAATGAVSFVTAPNFEAPADAGANNVYDLVVTASDGTLSASRSVAITVQNANEAPVVTSPSSATVTENATGIAYQAAATDPDAGTTLSYALSGTDAARFTINAATGAVSFVTAPNFEAPADAGANNVYDLVVTASDGTLSASRSVAITVQNANEAPVVTSPSSATVTENATGIAYQAAATDPDAGTTLSYALSGTDAARFTINAATGAVSFVTAPNFEAPADAGANNVYDLVVTASDGTLSASRSVAITVQNANEAPVVTSPSSATVTENATGIAYQAAATDPDAGTTLSYALSGTDAARFTINAATGAVSFVTAPNFEAPADAGANNVYDLVVTASDGTLSASRSVAITVQNANEAPVVTSPSSATVTENATGIAYQAAATDPDAGTTLSYALSGTDAARFTINAATGAVSFVTAPNFEAPADAGANNVYDLVVTASDGTLSASRSVAITVQNANEAPVVTSPSSATVTENATGIAYQAAATDPDAGTTLSYALSGTDAARFTINAATGAVSFVTAPNFEAPADAGANNVYDLVVTASDGTLSASRSVAITVQNANEAPVVTSPSSATVTENATGIAYQAAATDPDAGTTLSYALSGTDAARFTINAATGAVSFVTAPNFEAPADAGANNVYDLVVTASDGTLSASRSVAITVQNANEALTGTNFADILVSMEGSDTILGLAGDDRIEPGLGDDHVDGGAGIDRAIYQATRSEVGLVQLPDGSYQLSGDATGSDNLRNIERIDFLDGKLVLDAEGIQIPLAGTLKTPSQQPMDSADLVYRLYAAAFGRTPDEGGFVYWSKRILAGDINAEALAQQFRLAAEFKAAYGSNLTDRDYVDKLYSNVLERPSDIGGLDFWTSHLTGGTYNRDQMMVVFAVSSENIANTVDDITNGYWVI